MLNIQAHVQAGVYEAQVAVSVTDGSALISLFNLFLLFSWFNGFRVCKSFCLLGTTFDTQ